MTSVDIIILTSILVLGGWVLYKKIMRSTPSDSEWRVELQHFARTKNLDEETVTRGPGEYEYSTKITWQWIKKVWSRNPSMTAPPKGSSVFKGTLKGFQFFVDMVLIRKSYADWDNEYLRMAVILPWIPPNLTIYPAGRIRRLVSGVKLVQRSSSHAQIGSQTAVSSSDGDDHASERDFLTIRQLRILEEFEARSGGVHVYDRKLFLIKFRDGTRKIDLNRVYNDLCALTMKLIDDKK